MERWHNKVAVVTGASAGIGAAIAKDLLTNGLQVIALARRLKTLEEIKRNLPADLQCNYNIFSCDVGDARSVDNAFDKIIHQYGGVDILVNSAGINSAGSLVNSEVSTLQDVMQTNVMGVVHCTRRAFKSMKERNFNGHIILLNSIVGHSIPCSSKDVPPELGIYCASKFALTAITEMYRQEFRHNKTKIKVTSISPGITDTAMVPDWLRVAVADAILHVEDVSSAVMYVIATPPHVQIHEMVVKPVGEMAS